MSDPSIIIAPPSNTGVSDNRHTSSRRSRRDLPKNKHKTKKRRRNRSSSSSSSSRSSSDSHKRDKSSQRLQHLDKRRRRCSTSSSSSSDHSIRDYGRYKRPRLFPQFAEVLSILQPVMTVDQHQLYIRIMWCNNQRTQILNQIRKPGPLTWLLMRLLMTASSGVVLDQQRKCSYKATFRSRALN